MFRKYVIITLAAFLVFGISACTSKKTDDNADVEATADSGDESLETADIATDNNDLAAETSGVADADMGDDGLAPEEKLPDDASANAVASAPAAESSDLTETPPTETLAAAPPPDAGEAPMAESAPPPEMASTPEPPPADTSSPPPVADSGSSYVPEPSAAPSQSLKKVNAQTYRQGKTLVNAYYIARDGDTVEGISQKVFGSPEHVKDLCKINQYNCSRGLKVGDKFYYNSPQRTSDDATVKSFYEDAGVAPQVYTAKAGDNIRKVGKELLGHERSWMELWATNDVESKGALDEGTALKYWPATEAAAPTQTMASSEPAPPAEEAPAPPPPDQAANQPPPMEEMPPPPPPDQAALPPSDSLPPAPDQAAAGSVEPPPPPPPPPTDAAPRDSADAAAMQDPNQTMALGVGAVLLLAAAALFISIRKKKRARQIDFNTTTQTQIE